MAVETGATVSPGVKDGTVLGSVGFAAPLLEEYIAAHSPVAPAVGCRIVDTALPLRDACKPPAPGVQQKVQAKLGVKLSTTHPKLRKTRVKATIRVTAPGVRSSAVTGRLVVKVGKKTVRIITLTASKRGVASIRLPKFTKRGKTTVTVRYLGSSTLKPATRTVRVAVRA